MKFVNIFKLVEKSNIEQRDCKPACQSDESFGGRRAGLYVL
jgi:hypothetical protein